MHLLHLKLNEFFKNNSTFFGRKTIPVALIANQFNILLCFTYFVFSQLHFYRWYSYWSNLFRRSIYLNVRLRPRHWLIFINEPKNLQREGLYNTVQSGRWVKSGLLVPKVVFHPIYYDNTTRSLNKHYLRHFICPKTVISMLFEFHLLMIIRRGLCTTGST